MKHRFRIAPILCFGFSVLLLVFLGVQMFWGYQDYLQHPASAAPFYPYGLLFALPYVLLSATGFVAANLLRKRK